MLATHRYSQRSPPLLSSVSTFDPTFVVEFCNTKTLTTARPQRARGDLPGRFHLWLASWLRLMSQFIRHLTGEITPDCSKMISITVSVSLISFVCMCVFKINFYWSIVSVQCCITFLLSFIHCISSTLMSSKSKSGPPP